MSNCMLESSAVRQARSVYLLQPFRHLGVDPAPNPCVPGSQYLDERPVDTHAGIACKILPKMQRPYSGHGICSTAKAHAAKLRDVLYCHTEIRGDSEHDVLRKAAERAKNDHNMDSIPPDVLAKVKSAIHDEDEARAQEAGSAN